MKKQLLQTLIAIPLLVAPEIEAAHFSVTDALHIKTTLTTTKKDLLEQLLQGTVLEEQRDQLQSQIAQITDFLHRLGRLEDFRDLPGFQKEAEAFLRELELNLPSLEIIRDLDPEELFQEQGDSPYKSIQKDILIDGEKVAEIEGEVFRPELAALRTITHYEKVRTEVLEKRYQLKGDLEATMLRLQVANTTAEVQKLTAIINGLNVQMAATDSEMQFATNEVVARYHRSLTEKDIQSKVQIQRDRATLKSGMRKHLDMFQMPNQPTLFPTR